MINLLSLQKKSEVKSILFSRFVTLLFFVIVSYLIILIASLVPIYFYLKKQESDILFIQNALNKKEDYNQIKNFTETININNQRLGIFPSEDISSMSYVENIIDKIVEIKGSGVKINTINYSSLSKNVQEGASLEIMGVASNRKSLLDFKQRLENEKTFSSVVLPISSFVKIDNIPFTINLNLK